MNRQPDRASRPAVRRGGLSRRTLLLLAASSLAGAAWQASALAPLAPSRGADANAAPAPPTPTPTPTSPPTPPPPATPWPAPTRPYANRTLPPTRLIIPSIGLDARVVPLDTEYDRTGKLVWQTAAFAVGHHRGSANPGELGNTVLSGHISSPHEGAVFKRLPEVRVGDGVIVATAEQQYLYRVRETRVVTPDAVEVLDATTVPILTLITCVPDGVYSHRLVVRADAV